MRHAPLQFEAELKHNDGSATSVLETSRYAAKKAAHTKVVELGWKDGYTVSIKPLVAPIPIRRMKA